jgi:hypothetical protein
MLKLIYLLIGIIKFSGQIMPKNEKIFSFIEDNYDVVTIDKFYQYFDNHYIQKKDCEDIISLLSSLLDRYVYLDILKNPPEPFEKIDLLQLLETVCVNESNPNSDILIISMIQKIEEILSKSQDRYLYITPNSKNPDFQLLDESIAISPYKINFSNDGKAFAIPSKYISYFEQSIQNKIENHQDIEVSKINNKTPIDYIMGFNGQYNKLKSKQAQFIQNQNDMEEFYLFSYPFDPSFQKITIEFSNGDNIDFNYLVLTPKNDESFLFKDFKKFNFYDSKGTKKKKKKFI